ncbi:unnamed protein product, partial [Didymodactylos carnosus]
MSGDNPSLITSFHIGQRFDINNRSDLYEAKSVLLEGARNVAARFEDDQNSILNSR